jgi:hypothetical protein
VTFPPPSSTITGPWSLRTLAVAFIVIVTGAGPQSNVMMPPAATARTTASEVHVSGRPVPMTRVGREVSAARASAGMAALPFGFPGLGSPAGGVVGGELVGGGVAVPVGDADAESGPASGTAGPADPHPASTAQQMTAIYVWPRRIGRS